MKGLMLLLLAGIFILGISGFASADAVAGSAGTSAQPGNFDTQVCIHKRIINISPGDFFPFVPPGEEKLGADAPTINVLDLRPGDYAWNGEMIQFKVIVRDPNGALDIGHAFVRIDDGLEAVCNEIPLERACNPQVGGDEEKCRCDGLRPTGNNVKEKQVCITDSNGNVVCTIITVPIENGDTDPNTDRGFLCMYTVEPTSPDRDVTLRIGVKDAVGNLADSLYAERWRLNPSVSMDVRTSDGLPITFESGVMPEQYAHSLNRLFIENTAQKVSLWVFIAMTDLFDSNGPSKCPETNKIDVEGSGLNSLTGVYYRARSGTLITQLVGFPGDNPDEGWAHITNPNQNFECSWGSIVTQGLCTGARPLFDDSFLQPGLPAILTGWANNVLVPTGQAEVEFKLHYPKPCIGTYDAGQILVFGKPV
ncbi:MAG: hypothetical protein HYX24_04645 [Candidatus Aenigmarchaeota archaeon]|nr:hypothetical protein [Candidatus Aenigmarchaeota archaeon]